MSKPIGRNDACEKLFIWMQNRGFSQSDLAKHLNILQPTLSRHMSGENHPTLQSVYEIEIITRGDVKMIDWLRSGNFSND